jgi:hypothetical protein
LKSTTKTTIYLLNQEGRDSIGLLIDALAEYMVNHPEKIEFAKVTGEQIQHCQKSFTEPYQV